MDELVELLESKLMNVDFDTISTLETEIKSILYREYGNNFYIDSNVEGPDCGYVEIQFSENIPGDNFDQLVIIIEFSFIDSHQSELIVDDIYWEYIDE